MVSPAGPAGRERRTGPLLRTTLGDVLRRIRLAQGRTLADVARAAKVSLPYLSELERGRKEASSEILAAICAALRVELADLLAETGRQLAETGRTRRAGRAGRAPVVRLDDIRGRRGSLAPAAGPAGQDPAAPPQPASDDARCLLAA